MPREVPDDELTKRIRERLIRVRCRRILGRMATALAMAGILMGTLHMKGYGVTIVRDDALLPELHWGDVVFYEPWDREDAGGIFVDASGRIHRRDASGIADAKAGTNAPGAMREADTGGEADKGDGGRCGRIYAVLRSVRPGNE